MRRVMRRGLTLIEVLMAVLILSIGLTVLLTGASRCLAVMRVAKSYQQVQWTLGMGEIEFPFIVEEEIEELNVDPVEYDNGFSFSREVEEEPEEEELQDDLYVVWTYVTWMDRGSERRESFARYFYYEEEE